MPEDLMEIIQTWKTTKKTGSIQINFFKGGIANLIIKESVKIGSNITPKKKEVVDYGKEKN